MKSLPSPPAGLLKLPAFRSWHESLQKVLVANDAEMRECIKCAEGGDLLGRLQVEKEELRLKVVELESEVLARSRIIERMRSDAEAAVAESETVVLFDDEREGFESRIAELEKQLAAVRVELKSRTSERDGAWRRIEKLKARLAAGGRERGEAEPV